MSTADRAPLFRGRFRALLFLIGLAVFWSGFLVISLTMVRHDPVSRQISGPEAGTIAVTVLGGLAAGVAQPGELLRMKASPFGSTAVMMRMLLPSTLADAARSVGLNGKFVAGGLYLVLAADVVAFFGALALR